MKRHFFLALLSLSLLLLVLLFPGLPWSKRYHHALKKMIVKAEMRLAKWRGTDPKLATIAGKILIRASEIEPLKGATIEALDSTSGWATVSDGEGRFVLPDVIWYPGAQYSLLVTTDAYIARQFKLAAPLNLPAKKMIDAGELYFDEGCEVDLTDGPETNSIHYIEYDAENLQYYKELFAELTKDLDSDEEKFEAINRYVATKLNLNEQAKQYVSPRQVLEEGSRYCGHLAQAMAAIVEAGNYKTRILDLNDGRADLTSHAVLEIYYDDGWHLYDPAFGVAFHSKNGRVASYRELRLDPSPLLQQAFREATHKTIHGLSKSDRMPGVYSLGFHHFYSFKKHTSQTFW